MSEISAQFIANYAGTARELKDSPDDAGARIAAMVPNKTISEPLSGTADDKLDKIWARLNEMGWILTHMEQLCPYHDTIVKLQEMPEKVNSMADNVHNIELRMAAFAAIGGLAGTLGGGMVMALIQKAMGL